MSLSSRISVLLLAIVPIAWGLCPCMLAEAVSSPTVAQKIAESAPACCPRCKAAHELAHSPGQPPAPPKPCESCGLMDAGWGTMPSQPVPALPVPALAGFLALLATVPPLSFAPVDAPVMDTGPPPPRLDGIVLLI